MTHFESWFEDLLAALNTGRPSGVPEHREWSGLAIEPSSLPRATVAIGNETTQREGAQGPTDRHVVVIDVEYLTRKVDGTPDVSAQLAAEPMRAWAIKALEGQRLGGKVRDISLTGTQRTLEQGEVPLARTTVQFDVTYSTRVGDAEQRV